VKGQVDRQAGNAVTAGQPVSHSVEERRFLVHAAAVPEQCQRPPLGGALGQP